MKNLSFILFVFIGLNMQAQKQLEKEVAYQGQEVKIDLDFASDIEMKTWKKSAIKVVASVQTEDEKYTEMYELEVNSSDSHIEIGSNSKEIFETHREEHPDFGNDLNHEFDYTLYVPEGVELNLRSITGSVASEFLQGDFKIDLVIGDIKIEEFKGNLDLKTVTGKLNLPVKDSSYSAKTVLGQINGDPTAERKNGIVGKEAMMDLRDTENRLTLATVTGDIYLN